MRERRGREEEGEDEERNPQLKKNKKNKKTFPGKAQLKFRTDGCVDDN